MKQLPEKEYRELSPDELRKNLDKLPEGLWEEIPEDRNLTGVVVIPHGEKSIKIIHHPDSLNKQTEPLYLCYFIRRWK